jgi:hypothetical protein
MAHSKLNHFHSVDALPQLIHQFYGRSHNHSAIYQKLGNNNNEYNRLFLTKIFNCFVRTSNVITIRYTQHTVTAIPWVKSQVKFYTLGLLGRPIAAVHACIRLQNHVIGRL